MYQQWNQGAGQLNQALQGISTLLSNAATTYAQTEQAIAQSMQQG
jgi:WXG100 family type VII secretion target